jgi:anti-sigma regulatory factor (Ser/Thr protein kinase)
MPAPTEPFHWTILRVGSLRECLEAWQTSRVFAALDETLRTSSSIVLDELGSNFLRFSGARSKEMKLTITFKDDELTMTFDDDGVQFDPGTILPPPSGNLGLLPTGGRGLHMARHTMDSWDYQYVTRRNINVLKKWLRHPEEDEKTGN